MAPFDADCQGIATGDDTGRVEGEDLRQGEAAPVLPLDPAIAGDEEIGRRAGLDLRAISGHCTRSHA
jgi:hypothetical protein